MSILNLDIKIGKKGSDQLLSRKSKSIQINETTTVAQVKEMVQDELNFPFEKESEQFFYMSKELKDTDIVPNKSGNQYIVTFK